jgi:DNA modification methylase
MGQLSAGTRMYATADEKCLFVMMGKQDMAQNKDQFPEEWRPLLNYFKFERDKIGWTTKDVVAITGKTSASHYFAESQFQVPTKEHYESLQAAANGQAFTEPFDKFNKQANDAMSDFYESRAYFNNMHDNMNNVWHISRTSQSERVNTGEHATPKPIALCSRAILSSSRENEIVLDVFGGSGSTLIACEQLNRKCYMMELDPKYIDVIIKRWENFTGNKAIKLAGDKQV